MLSYTTAARAPCRLLQTCTFAHTPATQWGAAFRDTSETPPFGASRRRAAPRRAPAAPPSRQHHARGVSHAVEGHPRAVEDVRLVLAEAARGENLVQSCQGELPARHPQRCLLSAPRGSPRAAHARHPPPPRAPHSLSMTSSTCHKGTGWPPGARPARQQPLGAEKGKQPFRAAKRGRCAAARGAPRARTSGARFALAARASPSTRRVRLYVPARLILARVRRRTRGAPAHARQQTFNRVR